MRALISVLIPMSLVCLAACGDDEDPPIEPTYENVAATIDRGCTFSAACHGGAARGSADLNFETAGDDLTTVLNGVSSCQYDLMPRVDPGNPDNSWLIIKIDGMYGDDGQIQFTPEAGWMSTATDADCQTFGGLMPSNAMPTPLPMSEVTMFREWIRLGAPGPSGG